LCADCVNKLQSGSIKSYYAYKMYVLKSLAT